MDQIHKEGCNILYVDDEESNLNAFKNLFRRKFNIIITSSCQKALEILEVQPIHVIIADQRMPEMTGVEFLKNAKIKWPDLKYILLTAFHDSEVIKEAVNEAGIYWYMNKPFEPDQMERIIYNAINAYRAENELKESEEKFREVFNSISDVFARTNLDGEFVMLTPSVYNLTGYKVEELMGRNVLDFYNDPKERESLIQNLEKHGGVQNIELKIRRKDGTNVIASSNSKFYYNNTGSKIGIESIFRDVTKQKEIEKKLRASEKHFNILFEESPVAEIIVNEAGRITMVNKEAKNIFGYDFNEMDGQLIEMLLPEKYRMKHSGKRADFHASNQKREMDEEQNLFARHKNGNEFQVEIALSPFEINAENMVHCAIQDISIRKQAEKELQISEEKFKTLVTNTEEIIYMIDKDGTFLLSEGKGLSKIGLKAGDVVGKSVFELYKDYPAMIDKMRKALNGETVITEIKIGDNYFKNWYTPQSNQEGEVISLLGLSINITKQKKTEIQILDYQKRLKAMASELAVNEEIIRKQIAVDLHDDVGQLLASSRMQLARVIDLEENPEVEIRIKNISQALLKAIQATREAIFNLSPPQLNEIGLYAAVHDWMKEQVEKKHNISTSITGEQGIYHLDEKNRVLIFRSIKELIMNAVKHAKARQLKVAIRKKDNFLEIAVEDDGVGFDYNADLLRLKSDSYGLFSIQERISDLGGLMVVDSVIDKGTKIKLTVPLNDKIE